jgi:hypothetical protein
MTDRRGREGERKVKSKQRERGRDKEGGIGTERQRDDCLGVLDEQFGYAV